MLTLDEAIKHCEEKAKEIRKANEEMPTDCKLSEDLCECANEHEQLAKWLEELAERREADRWIPVSERLPEEKKDTNTNDFAEVLCTTIFGGVRLYKYGTRIGDKQAHFWYGWGIFDSEIIAWKYLPKPYKESEAENETDN